MLNIISSNIQSTTIMEMHGPFLQQQLSTSGAATFCILECGKLGMHRRHSTPVSCLILQPDSSFQDWYPDAGRPPDGSHLLVGGDAPVHRKLRVPFRRLSSACCYQIRQDGSVFPTGATNTTVGGSKQQPVRQEGALLSQRWAHVKSIARATHWQRSVDRSDRRMQLR